MPEDRGMSRRKVLGIGAATLASTALGDIVSPATALAAGSGPGRIGYFGRFGVDEALIRQTLSAALVQGRRVRRPLLPAPGLQQLRPRGRGGEPRLCQRRARAWACAWCAATRPATGSPRT